MSAEACDRCGEEISTEERAAGYPIAIEEGYMCASCADGICACGAVLPATDDRGTCAACICTACGEEITDMQREAGCHLCLDPEQEMDLLPLEDEASL